MQHLPTHPTKRHPLTGAPIQAIWVRPDGRAMWPILGASEDGDAGAGDGSGDQGGDDGGDAGDDATEADNKLAQARQEAVDRRKELKPWKDIAREFGVTPDQARELLSKAKKAPADADDAPDADAIQREADRKANERANARIVRADVRALAAETFEDPADAALYVDLTQFEVDDDGETDADEIKKALADVLKSKPHLAKATKGPKPDRSQGPRGGAKADPGPGVARLRQAYADTSK